MNEHIDWLLSEGRLRGNVPDLLSAFVPRLAPHRVERVWAGTTVLHPQAAAYGWIWTPEGSSAREFSHDKLRDLSDEDSPMRRLRHGASSVRFRSPHHDNLDDIRAIHDAGYTDFYGVPFRVRGDWVGGFTWSTKHPDGFRDEDIHAFRTLTPALSAVVEPMTRDSMYTTLLKTYLGDDAGRRVAAGQVRRGDGQTLRAAVLFSDVRNFTVLSQELDTTTLLSLLGDVFEVAVQAVQDHGGQVLKFMGDGLLAVFLQDDATDQATVAALEVQRRLRECMATRDASGLPTAALGIGLNYGDLTYGNIGSPTRLDFTVIGPCVNLAARIEGQCGRLGESVLGSQDFAERASGWERVGFVDLKGIATKQPVYRPA